LPLFLFALGLLSPGPAAGELPGVDDVVFGDAARMAGRAATAPIAGRSEEAVGSSMFLVGGLVAGIVLGRGWARLHDAPGRGRAE
jgi:hypothetical protein